MPRAFALLVLLVAGAAAPAGAQSLWINPQRAPAFHVEYLNPRIDGTAAFSGALFAGLRAPIGRYVTFVAEVPFAYGDTDLGPGFDLDEETSTIGNPYVGIELGEPWSPVSVHVGGRAPVVGEVTAATSIGLFADIVDRPEAFIPENASGSLAVHLRQPLRGGVVLLGHGGVTAWFPTDGGQADPDLHAVYGARMGWVGRRATLLGGLSGRADLGEAFVCPVGPGECRDADLAERTLHQVAFAGATRIGPLVPGVELRVPLDDDVRELVDVALGFSLTLELR